jgi:signal transduction histidine kinase
MMPIAPDPLWSEKRLAGAPNDIGRQLHDIVVPQLFVLTTGLAALQRHPDRSGDDCLVDDLVETAAQALADLRAISRGRTLALGGPLHQVVERLIHATQSVAHLSACDVTIEATGDCAVVEPSVDHDIQAVVWEALANAIRHGRANAVAVDIASAEGNLRVVVIDNGSWQTADPSGTGLAGLRRRAVARKGRFDVQSTESGTRLLWEVPLVTCLPGTTRR